MLEQEKRRERLLLSTGVTSVRGGEPYFNNNVIGTVNITNALFLTVLNVYSTIHSAAADYVTGAIHTYIFRIHGIEMRGTNKYKNTK